MNVQIPHMATKRVCDTLDRLKQDIVKLILLRVGAGGGLQGRSISRRTTT